MDFWCNICLCHSLIVEEAEDGGPPIYQARHCRPCAQAEPEGHCECAHPTKEPGALHAKRAPCIPAAQTALGRAGCARILGYSGSGRRFHGTPQREMLRAQGPSPDEVALVEGGRQLGFEFVKRVKDGCVLRLAGVEAQFEVLNVMEYSSARSRMSVVARAPSGAIRLYCKGADTKARPCFPPREAQGVQGSKVSGFLNVMEYPSARSRMSVVARAPSGAIRLYCKGADTKARARMRIFPPS